MSTWEPEANELAGEMADFEVFPAVQKTFAGARLAGGPDLRVAPSLENEQVESMAAALRAYLDGGNTLTRDAGLLLVDLRGAASLRDTVSLNLGLQRYEAESAGPLDTSVFLG